MIYFFYIFGSEIQAVTIIKKGLINSTGCSLKKYKLSHLFAPLPQHQLLELEIEELEKLKRMEL